MDSRFSWSTDYHHPTMWDQEFPPLSLPDMFAASVARKGDAPMLDFMGRQFAYAEVARGASRPAPAPGCPGPYRPRISGPHLFRR